MHVPVLLNEVLSLFVEAISTNVELHSATAEKKSASSHINLRRRTLPKQFFVDATAGRGGHTLALSRAIRDEGRVLAVEYDTVEASLLKEKIETRHIKNIEVVNANFKDLEEIVKYVNFPNPQGILFDLGFSLWHIKESGRGFTFQKNEKLDMRYNPNDSSRPTVSQILNTYSENVLEEIFRIYGEERKSTQIARKIVEVRRSKKITTTNELTEIILQVARRKGRLHPATKVFQALRIAVNDEFGNIEKGLNSALKILDKNGKIAVITFHSLEDRLVKNIFKEWKKNNFGELVNKKVIRPKFEEIKQNPRARSAKLRIFKKF